jgi:uncharacterized cupin superfamily protein
MSAINVVTPATDSVRYDFAGQEGRLLEDGTTSRGSFAASTWTLEPGGFAPPLHRHRSIDEAVWVVSGTLEITDGERSWLAEPGTFASIPAGAAHTMSVAGAEPVQILLVMSTPDRAVESFEKLSAAFAGGPPQQEQMESLLAEIDLELAGVPA